MNTFAAQVNLLDTWIDNVDLDGACRAIENYIKRGTPQQVTTVNLDFLRLCVRDEAFRKIVNESSLVVPDGMPLVWASRLQSEELSERVAGVDLVMQCARLSAEGGYRVFLLGAAPGVADSAAAIMRERYPGVTIVGTHSPPSLDDDADALSVSLIKEAQPDILLVAFGAPRQELWIRKHMHSLGVPVCIGVGGSFDMISGRVSRAPMWMQDSGLEWFFRFIMEPKRLWKRYFVQDLPILLRLISWSTSPSAHPIPALQLVPQRVPSREVMATGLRIQ